MNQNNVHYAAISSLQVSMNKQFLDLERGFDFTRIPVSPIFHKY